MKLKEIKPGMVIHCRTEEEAEKLLEYLDGLGYKWCSGTDLTSQTLYVYKGNTCYYVKEDFMIEYGSVYETIGKPITKFSDLIEPELTTEEVLSILAEIDNICSIGGIYCNNCPLSAENAETEEIGDLCDIKKFKSNEQKIIEICQQWKSDHEKKEPEVEWFWQGRIFKSDENGYYYQVKDGDGLYDTGYRSRKSAEEYMADELKEYCKTHEGNYIAMVEHICRVKAVE